MRKELIRVALGSLAVIVLLPLLFGGATSRDFLPAVGITGLCVSAILFFAGLAMAIFKESRKWGQAALLTSVVLLLISFSLCTSSSNMMH